MKKTFAIRVDDSAIANLEEVASADHMQASSFGAVLFSKFSDLKPGYALRALAAIPPEYFRRGPGRPSAAVKSADPRELTR